MNLSILWLDNEPAYLAPYVDSLRDAGFDVTIAVTATEAEELLRGQPYTLVIIDVMVPTRTSAEEEVYTPAATSSGYQTGLVFWIRNSAALRAAGTAALVLTVRLDESIRDEFTSAGLPVTSFSTKYELSDPDALVATVKRAIAAANVKMQQDT